MMPVVANGNNRPSCDATKMTTCLQPLANADITKPPLRPFTTNLIARELRAGSDANGKADDDQAVRPDTFPNDVVLAEALELVAGVPVR